MKYKNWKGERLLSSILYLLTPFAFMANPLLFVVCVTAQLVLQTLHGYRFSELFVVLLLNGFVYSSVSFVGLRFYDWIIIFSFVYCSSKHAARYKSDFGINNSNMQSDAV